MPADRPDQASQRPGPEREADAGPPGNLTTAGILESVSDGVFTVDRDWRITSFNRAAEEITGVPRDEAVGRACCEVFRADACEANCPLRRTLESGEPVVSEEASIIRSDGVRVPISISTGLLRSASGEVVGGVETFRDLSALEELRKEIEGRRTFGDVVSHSPAMWRVLSILPDVAASETTVLIQGETGTGKELLARATHDLSSRQGRPFVPVNCAALPQALLESELFGHVKGAFTGADRDKPGRLARAEGGTLFLDEIGDMPAAVQVKLLRLLQNRTYEPVGSVETLHADVRVIAATNRDLDALVRDGAFREDLYYRINVIRLDLPPLRERREDIPLLLDHFIEHFNRLRGKSVQGMSREALSLLLAYDYPGNVRELENIVEHAFVLCKGARIRPEHLPEHLGGRTPERRAPAGRARAITREVEARLIQDALRRNDYNRLAAARELGMHKTTLFRKIKALGLDLPARDGRSRPRGKG